MSSQRISVSSEIKKEGIEATVKDMAALYAIYRLAGLQNKWKE